MTFRRVAQCPNQLPPRTSTRKRDIYITMLNTYTLIYSVVIRQGQCKTCFKEGNKKRWYERRPLLLSETHTLILNLADYFILPDQHVKLQPSATGRSSSSLTSPRLPTPKPLFILYIHFRNSTSFTFQENSPI